MQYLSKAYNYYSGINPATLSGAIDVIVVRHVDTDGTVTLSSSPFHVRFGKLQVLRAAEKRVTIRLPNNLPAPHVAPFHMKVGETGEAFFVVETDEQVPADLLTSPVVMPTETEVPPSTPLSDEHPPEEEHLGSLTQEPFGDTEQQVPHESPLGEVDFLDLNASPFGTPNKRRGDDQQDKHTVANMSNSLNKSPVLGTASTLLPSPLKPSPSKYPGNSPPPPPARQPSIDDGIPNGNDESEAKQSSQPVVSNTNDEPNPMQAHPGEKASLPLHDRKLEKLKSDSHNATAGVNATRGEGGLPKVKAGQGEGPEVVYGKDVVLDMDGYHSSGNADGSASENEQDGSVEAFIQDLLASIQPAASAMDDRPKPRKSKSADTEVPSSRGDEDEDEDEDDDAHTPVKHSPEQDLSSARRGLPVSNPRNRPPTRSRLDRGQSEPPQFQSQDGLSRSPDRGAKAAMEMEWDWGRRKPLGSDDEMDEGGSTTIGRPPLGRLKNVEENPYMFVLEVGKRTHMFELALCEEWGHNSTEASQEAAFIKNRLTFQTFIESPAVVDDANIVLRDNDLFFTWSTGYRLLYALAMYRRALVPPSASPSSPTLPAMTLSSLGAGEQRRRSDSRVDTGDGTQRQSGYGWSRWWRRGQSSGSSAPQGPSSVPRQEPPREPKTETAPARTTPVPGTPSTDVQGQDKEGGSGGTETEAGTRAGLQGEDEKVLPGEGVKNYAKTLRLSSEQLQQLHLKPGPNTVQFSVTSSYSGLATCTARIFLWEETDQIVISDIDGTITKSDALGHVFAAIGRDWTHLGIAKLYTDIGNNGYKILYLTSRAIGQADTTREYLKSIAQGQYRMPEGPVLMSPDRLMASLHREVIMRKPELFKMACLRDIQRLFGTQAKEAFYAGFGNRITDAMSYRSVGIDASKIYTIDSTGVVRTELLQAAGHKGSYIQLNDLVNEVFPPVSTKFKPEYTDFNYWRDPVPDIPLPDFSPPSPALSARSDTSGRLSVLGKIAGIGRRSSRATMGHAHSPSSASMSGASASQMDPSSRPSSPLIAPSVTSDDLSEVEDGEGEGDEQRSLSSMPGSFEDDRGKYLNDPFFCASRPWPAIAFVPPTGR